MTPVEMDPNATAPPKRAPVFTAAGMAIIGATISALAMAALVMATDPTPKEEQMFIALLLIAATGAAWAAILVFGRKTASPLADTIRALRRAILFGLACCGAAILQVNAAFNPGNVAFLLLVLLIIEMVFVARRQNPV